jgi:hypothetical protein
LFSNCVSQVFKHDILGQHQLIAQPIAQKSNEINHTLNQLQQQQQQQQMQQRHQLQNNFENLFINDPSPALINDSELQPRSLSASLLSSTHKRSSNSDLNTLTNPLPINSHMSIEPVKRVSNQINNLSSFSDNDLNSGTGQNCMIGSYHSVSDISVLSDDDSTAFYSNYTKNLNANNMPKSVKLMHSQSDSNGKKVKNKALSQSDDFEFLRPKDPPAISSQSSGQLYTLSANVNKLKYDQNLYTSNSNNNSLSSTNSSYSPSLSLNNTNQSELNLSTNKYSAPNKVLSNNSNNMPSKSSEAYQNSKSMLFGIPRDSPMPTMVSTNSHKIDSPFVDVSMNNMPSIYETTPSVANNLIDTRNRSPLIQNCMPSPNVNHHLNHQQQQQQQQHQQQQQQQQPQHQSNLPLSTSNHGVNHQLLNQMQLNLSTSQLNTHQINQLNSSHSSSISSSSNNSSSSSSHPFTQSYNQSTNWFLKTANQQELPRQLLSNTENCPINQPHFQNDLVNNNCNENFYSERLLLQNRADQIDFPVNSLKPNLNSTGKTTNECFNMIENISSNNYQIRTVQNQIEDNATMSKNVEFQRSCENRLYQPVSITPTIAHQSSSQDQSQLAMLNQHQQLHSQRVFLTNPIPNANSGLLSSRNNSASNLNFERQPSPGLYRDDVAQSLNNLANDSKSKLSGYNLSPNLSANAGLSAKSQPITHSPLGQTQITSMQPKQNEHFQYSNFSHQIVNSNIPVVGDYKRDAKFDQTSSQLINQNPSNQQALRKSEEFNNSYKISSNMSTQNSLNNRFSVNNPPSSNHSSNQTSNFGLSQCDNDDNDEDGDDEDGKEETEDDEEDEQERETENVFGVALKELKEKKWPHSPATSNMNSIYLNDTSMLPKLNYVSLMLDEYCDKNTSMNTQVLAMKYLKNTSIKKQIRSQTKQSKQAHLQNNHHLDKISENSTYESADLSTYYSGDSLNATTANQRNVQPFQYFNHFNNQSMNISNISTNAMNTHVFSGNENSNVMSSTQAISNMSNSNQFKEFSNPINNSREMADLQMPFKFAKESTNVYQNQVYSMPSSSFNDNKHESKNEPKKGKADERIRYLEDKHEKDKQGESQDSEESEEDENEDGEIWLFKKPFENGFKNELDKANSSANQQANSNTRKKLQKQQRRGDAKNRQKNFSDEDEIDRDVTTVLDIERLKRLPKLL